MGESVALDKLAPALVALQADLVPVEKSAENPFFKSKYAPLPEVRKSLQPLLSKHKFALTSFPAMVEGRNGLKFYLIHESGQYLCGEWQLSPVKQDPQGEGSATTYMRRYGDMAITGMVADEDDDANAASDRGASSTPAAAPRASSSKPASEKQLNLVAQLASKAGYDSEWIFEAHEKIHTSADASAVIEKLQTKIDGNTPGERTWK